MSVREVSFTEGIPSGWCSVYPGYPVYARAGCNRQQPQRGLRQLRTGTKWVEKSECPHRTSNPIRTLAVVRATGLEPARFWQWNLNPPSLPIPPCPLNFAECAAVCFAFRPPGYLNTNTCQCQSTRFHDNCMSCKFMNIL